MTRLYDIYACREARRQGGGEAGRQGGEGGSEVERVEVEVKRSGSKKMSNLQ